MIASAVRIKRLVSHRIPAAEDPAAYNTLSPSKLHEEIHFVTIQSTVLLLKMIVDVNRQPFSLFVSFSPRICSFGDVFHFSFVSFFT